MKLKRILVTTDFSELSRQVFPTAASLARRFKAELHLAHVAEALPIPLVSSPTGRQSYSPEQDYRLKLKDLLARTAEDPSFGGLSVKPHLLEGGYVHERLARFQKREGIDLTVIATHGRTGLSRLFLGSFAERVVRLSVSPLLVYRPSTGRVGGEEEFSPQKILVPFDFSENARAALDAVRLFAGAYNARLRFQCVLEPIPDPSLLYWEGIAVDKAGDGAAQALEKARRELECTIREELPERDQVQAAATFGTPFLDLVKAAREFEADLIIMATHGRTGLKHMLLGSVAEKVVRTAPCSVLTVRPAGMVMEQD